MIGKIGTCLLGLLLLPAACSRADETGELVAGETPLGRATQRVIAVEGAGVSWEVLDAARDGSVLYGLRSAPVPDSDARATYLVRYLGAEGQPPQPVGGGALFDAVFSPSGDRLALVTSPAGELRVGRPGGPFEPVDTDVVPGAGFSPDGASLVYAKGPRPELDIRVADLASMAVRTITDDPAPDYLPAFSPDGRQIAFVSTRGGFPSIWVAPRAGGAPRQLTNVGLSASAKGRGPAPDGREAPLWAGGVLVFSDGASVSAVSEATGQLAWIAPGARRPRWLVPGESLAVEYQGHYRAVRALEGP